MPARMSRLPARPAMAGTSPSSSAASTIEPAGSPRMVTETKVAGKYLSAQLNDEWPTNCGTSANNASQR